jgi:hypothetical protein
MSLSMQMQPEPDGTLKYVFPAQDVIVRVLAQRRNGTKRCPVELLHQAGIVLATDCNLRDLHDLEQLQKHAGTLRNGPAWHEILTAVAAALPNQVHAPWDPVVKDLADYQMEPTAYLWYPALPHGEPVGVDGDTGVGKSALLVKLICHITTGTPFPTLFADRPEQPFAPRHVLLCTYEDDMGKTVRPRVHINGGDVHLVHNVEGKRDPDTGEVLPMTLQDLGTIEKLLKQYTPALLAFDPLQSFLGPDVDMNRAGDTRPVLDAISRLCKGYGCTLLYVRHNGKTQRSKAMHAPLGTVDITGNLRSEMALYKDPDDPERRILAQTKTNGRWAPSMYVKLVGVTFDVPLEDSFLTLETVRVDWDGKSDLTADDITARETAHGNDTEEANSALEAAREFLREVLKDGPLLVDDLFTQAKKAGVSEKTLRRAKDKERVKARRRPQDGIPGNKWPWEWYDPTRHGGTP